MWWGGGTTSEEEEKSTTSTDQEVMEILSEEDAKDDLQRSSEDDDEEFKRLRQQFREQETLLGELKGVLRSNTQKLANKEKEVQVCARIVGHS